MKRRSLLLFLLVSGSFILAEIPKKQVIDQSGEPLSKKSSFIDADSIKKPAMEPVFKKVSFTSKDAFDPQKKRQDVINLVARGIEFLEKNPFVEFARRINLTSEFKMGDLYLFVDNEQGRCLAQGVRAEEMWKDIKNTQNIFGTMFVQKMIDTARRGGGWVTYELLGAAKVSYVKMVEKDGKKYVIGCGYYPHTKEDAAVSLVRGAISTFYSYSNRGAAVEEAFSEFSFLGGTFIYGDLSIIVFDKDLVVRANGGDPSEIGTSYWDIKDQKGVYFFRAIPKVLEAASRGEGRWFEYERYNAPMRSYVERVVDKKGMPYFIMSSYVQRAENEVPIKLVKRAKEAIEKRGLVAVVGSINDRGNKEFVYGPIGLFIYALDGTVVAEAARPSVVGKNISKDRDESGFFYVKDMLTLAKKQDQLWISYRTKRAVCSVYAETFEAEGKKYLIGAGFFPITKENSMQLLVKNSLGLFESVSDIQAFKLLSAVEGAYVIGDLMVFVYDLEGTCYVDGLNSENVWRNMLQDKDEEGRPYVKIMINEGRVGPAKVIFKKNGARMVSYVEPLKKGNKTYIIGSGYFL
jgi:hypothetical protein